MSGEAISSPIVPPGPRGDVEMSQVGEDRIPAEKPDAELDNVFANEARGGISTTSGGGKSKKLEARKKGSKAASILGMGGPSFGWRDITLPRIISMLFFGGGEYVVIPAFWALAGAAVFIFRMKKKSGIVWKENEFGGKLKCWMLPNQIVQDSQTREQLKLLRCDQKNLSAA